MARNKIKNPLLKRVPREFLGDWKKYIVVMIFLTAMIGVTAGVYVANNSMMAMFDTIEDDYKLEDGHFELNKKADSELISAIESGEKADIKAYYANKAHDEFDEKFEEEFTSEFNEAFNSQIEESVRASVADMGLSEDDINGMVLSAQADAKDSEDYKLAYEEAYNEAYSEAFSEIDEEIEEEISKAENKYGLNDDSFSPVPVTVYENFYVNLSENEDSRIRVFKYQENVDLPCIHKGRLPETGDEIAIDRMHADNANIKLGDVINVGGSEMKVVGLISLANYTTLHENNSDMMFNALTFDAAIVNDEGFEKLSSNRNVHYMYTWIYDVDPEDKISEAENHIHNADQDKNNTE